MIQTGQSVACPRCAMPRQLALAVRCSVLGATRDHAKWRRNSCEKVSEHHCSIDHSTSSRAERCPRLRRKGRDREFRVVLLLFACGFWEREEGKGDRDTRSHSDFFFFFASRQQVD